MKRALALCVIAIGGLLGLVTADELFGGTKASPIAGAWGGGGHKITITGSLEGGFSVIAGESWSVIGCPVAAGTVLTQYSPSGGSSYSAMYLWTENTDGNCTNSTRGPETVTVVLSGNSLTISGCGYAYCGTLTRVSQTPTTTRTSPTTTAPKKTTTSKKDTSPPRVTAFAKGLTAPLARPGSKVKLTFRVSDDSGRAKVHVALFSGGALVGKTTSGWGPANGSTWWWNASLKSELLGPMYFCANAVDKAGNKGRNSCAWISMVVPIAKVSNGCGGGDWDALVKVQNYFGNRHSYQQSLARSYSVNFVDACNLHDAAYGGYTVWDTLSRRYVDFHSWSRPRVDRKFLADMRALCDAKIPASAKNAHEKCYSTGGTLSIGALALYNFVDKQGWRFFDADPTVVGTQGSGPRSNFG